MPKDLLEAANGIHLTTLLKEIGERLQKIKAELTLIPPTYGYKLKNDRGLTIKQADKGSCIIVMDTNIYIQ